jgi:hypothetical protein
MFIEGFLYNFLNFQLFEKILMQMLKKLDIGWSIMLQ